jgi:methylmalonyl-CoA mutase C-terminal domain/subunit
LHQTAEGIVRAAVEEGVDVVALSILSGAHAGVCRQVLQGLKDAGATDVLVILGGTVLKEEIQDLKNIGVAEVFPPGSPLEAGVDFLKDRFADQG